MSTQAGSGSNSARCINSRQSLIERSPFWRAIDARPYSAPCVTPHRMSRRRQREEQEARRVFAPLFFAFIAFVVFKLFSQFAAMGVSWAETLAWVATGIFSIVALVAIPGSVRILRNL